MDIERLLATRTSGMEASAIREILKVATSPGVVSLAGGLPAPESFPLDLIPELTETVLGRYGARALQYDASEGFGPFREALIPYLAERGVATNAGEVVVFSGSQGVLDGIGKILISPGDAVAVEAPTYLGALQAFNPYGPRYVEIETDDDGLIPESLDEALGNGGVKFVYLVPTFQNPTGRTIPIARRKTIADLLIRYDALLVEDDPYSDLRYVGERVPPIKSFAPDNVVYSSTLSKTFAPGLRLGFVVAPEVIRQWMIIARQGVDLHTNTLAQALASEYLSGGHLQRQLPKILDIYRPRRQAMLDAIDRYFPEDAKWTRPEGGMFIWIEGPAEVDSQDLYYACVDRKVAFVPGAPFFADGSRGKSTLRMNFTVADPDTIDRSVAVIADVLREMLAKHR